MPKAKLERQEGTEFSLEGHVAGYLKAVSERWLLQALHSNPGMLEMFRDRDRKPYRDMVSWAGWFAGKYLTGAVQVLRLTGNREVRRHLRWFVAELLSLQAEDGYLGPWPKEYRFSNRAPNAHQDKNLAWDTSGHYDIMLGLLLWYEETGDRAMLESVVRIADGICRKYLGKPEVRLVETGYSEMNLAPVHSLCLLYNKTKEPQYLRMARQIVDEEFAAVEPGGNHLAGNYLQAGLQGMHFYQTPKPRWESLHPMMAMAELYYITGEIDYRNAFEHFWWSILETDRHNNGGFSTGERAVGNPYAQGAVESCCTIAWIAYSVEMLRLTGNSVVADEIELSTLNSVTGMHSATGRWSTYDTPMDGVRRSSTQSIAFQAREGTPELNCCSVNTPRGFGMISDWALMRDEEGLVLNYYGPCSIEAPWGDGDTVRLTEKTDYPRTKDITLVVTPSRPIEFTLKLRIPYWSSRSIVKINGSSVDGIEPASYLSVKREWTRGDKIEIVLDMSPHIWVGAKECSGKVSLYRGSILLTYDRRFNDMDPSDIPVLNRDCLEGKIVKASSWLEPMMLIELQDGDEKLRLCDFGSAGEGGTPYRSWLPITTTEGAKFSRANPLRSFRP
jgi:DUF1680 family protein